MLINYLYLVVWCFYFILKKRRILFLELYQNIQKYVKLNMYYIQVVYVYYQIINGYIHYIVGGNIYIYMYTYILAIRTTMVIIGVTFAAAGDVVALVLLLYHTFELFKQSNLIQPKIHMT